MKLLSKLFATTLITALAFSPAFAGGEGWTNDYSAAKKTAAQERKDILLDFTGSDWCGWCVKLNNEVFSKDTFKSYADKNLVLVELDFPRNIEQSDEIKRQNLELKNAFGIRGFPTIIMTDEMGRPYAQTGYQRGGPDAYIKHLEELKEVRVERDQHLKAAESVQGIEKAKQLHKAMQTIGDDMAVRHYEPIVNQIIELDADNAEGLKAHYTRIQTVIEVKARIQNIMSAAQNGDAAGSAKKLGEIAEQDIPKDLKQQVLANKSLIELRLLQDKPAAKASMKQAIAADPESAMAKRMKDAMKQLFPEDAGQ